MKTAAVIRASLATLAAATIVATMTVSPRAQRGGRGGGTGGGEFGGFKLSRLETLAADFNLTKDQKKAVKSLLDEAHKGAAGTREALASSHAAIGAAISANKGQAEIDTAVKQYGQQAAAMTTLEMKALADMLRQLDPLQRTNGAAVRSAFFLMRGAFLDPRKWDAVPDSRSY